MNIRKFAETFGMDVDGHTLGVDAPKVRIEAIRWCFVGHHPDTCPCQEWTVLAAPHGHPRDVIRRQQAHGWADLANTTAKFYETTHLRADDLAD